MVDRPDLPIPISEQLLINASSEMSASRVLCTSMGRGQCAESIAERLPEAHVTCHFFDLYHFNETREFIRDLPNLEVTCGPDFPEGEYDLFVFPCTKGGESELTRELLESGYDLLKNSGWLLTAVDNAKDTWLHHEVEKLSKGLIRRPKPKGMVYRVQKKAPLKRKRDRRHEFAFRDGENLIKLVSRPGVFSHRQLDLGARALLEGFEVQPGMKVLDIGCGTGAVGLAAALRAEDVTVLSLDSSARAIECTRLGAELNGLSDRVTASLDADGSTIPAAQFDLAVGNPPYYSQYKIADIFLHNARRGLKPGGKAVMVTKQPEWFIARMEQLFLSEPTLEQHRGYDVITVVK